MKQSLTALVFLLSVCLLMPMSAQCQAKAKPLLYIGIEKNRSPYTNLDDRQQAYGILVDIVRHLCQTIKIECHFIAGNFDKLMHDLQTYRLDAIIVIDTVLLAKIDKLKLSPPLCNIQPVFIQKKSDERRTKREDFKQTTIGVLEGSLLHFYLLDEYSSHARLKPYPLLESGVFDLFSGKIDALFADQAFFNERVLKTALGRENSALTLIALRANEIELPATSMALVLKERDTELYTILVKAIQVEETLSDCATLLETNDLKTVKSDAAKLAPTD